MSEPGQDTTPEATKGYGAREDADTTRQAQHTQANDTPTDVNANAAVCRSQVLTTDALGKGFVANQERRQILADLALGLGKAE